MSSKTYRARRVLAIVTAAFVALLLLCTFLSPTIYKGYLPVVQVTGVESSTLPHAVEAEGRLVYLEKQTLRAAADWLVLEVFTEEGKFVREETPLFSVDISQFEIRRLQLETELFKADSEELRALLAAELGMHAQTYPADGVVKAPAEGKVVSFRAQAGQKLSAGDATTSLAANGAQLYAEVMLTQEQGNPFAKGDKAQLSIAEEARRGVVYMGQTAYLQKIEADGHGGFRLYFPVETHTASEGDSVLLSMAKSLGTYDYVIPRKAILMPRGVSGYVYVAGTRYGLFGKETYVELLRIEIAAQNENLAAVGFLDSLPQDAEIVLTTNQTLTPGGTVWIKR